MQFVGWYVHWSLTNFEFAFKFKFFLLLQFHEYLSFDELFNHLSDWVLKALMKKFTTNFFSSVKKRGKFGIQSSWINMTNSSILQFPYLQRIFFTRPCNLTSFFSFTIIVNICLKDKVNDNATSKKFNPLCGMVKYRRLLLKSA